MYRVSVYSIILCLIAGCQRPEIRNTTKAYFKLLSNEEIGIDFINQLEYDREFNVYKYRNYYNGGGVAIGDINNDGLSDIYFTGNLKANHLYLNQGDNKFQDITTEANVGGTRSWSTGVTMIDINSDGFLDIYVCNSGDIKGGNKENELFINNGDLTFTESAAIYGLNDSGFSTHASFFDYDKDGDLDVYLLNNSYQAIGSFNLRVDERPNRDVEGGDKLLRNDKGKYVDVSESAGIYGSVIGFGLGITVGDVNNDMWEDIYVSNDFFERDYLYINQKDGTFSEVLTDQMTSISGASMGADMADIDNDGNADIFVTEMLPSDPERLKSVTTFEDWNKYQYNVKNGYHHQFTRNTLQYNNGDGSFSELGRYSGVEASDWSWGALFFDMNNDGRKDLFIANGIYQDLTNQDYLQYVANEQVINSIINDDGVNYKELIDIIPSNPIPNHFYINAGELAFVRMHNDVTDKPSFSNGAAYGDLDNDGDLDLVINNVNMPPFIYENLVRSEPGNNYISITLTGNEGNLNAIGSRVEVIANNGLYSIHQLQPARGFQSSVDPKLVIGVGDADSVNIKVIWPNETVTVIEDVSVNQKISIDQKEVEKGSIEGTNSTLKPILAATKEIEHLHQENVYSDFNRERLIYHMKSNLTPSLAVGDLDGNGYEDVIVSGAKGQATTIFFKDEKGFQSSTLLENTFHQEQEHSGICLFDANADGALDIYISSGGVDVSPFSPYLFDELWLNDGRGSFSKSDQKLPDASSNISSSVAINHDYDGDGDMDLFVGERVKIGMYGAPCSGYILENDGKGVFSNITEQIAPSLINVGMINDATFRDVNGDGIEELLVVGEFMPLLIFEWNGTSFTRINDDHLSLLSGWYNAIHTDDFNNDGLPDLVLGNHGLNSRFKASDQKPLKLYFNDFDQNGFPEGIFAHVLGDGKDYPLPIRHNLIDQLKYLKKRFPDFESYKAASMSEVFTPEELKETLILEAKEFRSKILINKGNYQFEDIDLPKEVQYSPVFAIATSDFDHDGDVDIIMGGNQYNVLPEAGIYDASYGVYLENNGNASFKYIPPIESGFFIKGQVRDIVINDSLIHVGMNNDSLLTFKY